MRVSFTLNDRQHELTRELVETALKDKWPEYSYSLAVWVNDKWYPPKQAFVTPLGLTNRDVNSRFAWRQLQKLGFPVHDTAVDGERPDDPTQGSRVPDAQQRASALSLAVQLLAGSGASAEKATAAADELLGWLSAG